MEVEGKPHIADLGILQVTDHRRPLRSLFHLRLLVLGIGNLDRRLALEIAERHQELVLSLNHFLPPR